MGGCMILKTAKKNLKGCVITKEKPKVASKQKKIVRRKLSLISRIEKTIQKERQLLPPWE